MLPRPSALERIFAEAMRVIVNPDDPVTDLPARRIAQDARGPYIFVRTLKGGLWGEILASRSATPDLIQTSLRHHPPWWVGNPQTGR